jgi:hypothetical protein
MFFLQLSENYLRNLRRSEWKSKTKYLWILLRNQVHY